MKKNRWITLCCAVFLSSCISTFGQSPIYPFSVEIGGNKAELKSPSAIFAVIDTPVSANSIIHAVIETKMVIINAFPCDDSGTPTAGAAPAIIMIQGSNKAPLSKTLDGKKLKPGTYVANLIAEGKTARVFFTVKK